MKTLKVREIERDINLGTIKKEITLTNGVSFTSPSRGIKTIKPDAYLESKTRVKEIVKRIDDKALNALEEGSSSRIAKEIKDNYQKNALNLVIFNLIMDKVPDKNRLGTLAHHLYSSSDNTVILPTVRSAFLKEGTKISDKKIAAYQEMMKFIIEEIQAVGNSKVIIGTVPLIAPKYSRPIVNFYLEQGMNALAIDANTSDLISHETEARSILSTINARTPLNETFIYACNLGYPHFEQDETRADDFLSLFAYIDVMGGTFKMKGRPNNTPPRLKEFSPHHYAYKILPPYTCQPNELKNKNQIEQLKEANLIQDLIGEEKIESYIQKKSKVDAVAISRLKSIAGNIKVK
jgi:hypothetical protein